jgi:hypothetical protein
MKTDDEVYKLNDGHILEALDRLYVAGSYLEMTLSNHPLLVAIPEFKAEVEKATEILGDLYQQVGQMDSVSEITRLYKLSDEYKIGSEE